MNVTLDQLLNSLRVVSLPMRTKFRGITSRETALFQGPYGWGEFAPFLEYDDQESVPWLQSAIEQAFHQPPSKLRELIPINGTIPATDSKEEIKTLIALYPGTETFKVKVGTTLSKDLARIASVRSLRPTAKIRIDVNGTWSVPEAITNIRAIYSEATGRTLEYVEQPVASLDELRALKAELGSDIKIAGDEVLRKARDPFAIDLQGAVDVLMLKVAPLGGIARSLSLAAHHKIPVVVSSALESAIGISHGLRLAASLPNLDYACGLGTGALFALDLGRHEIINGTLKVNSFPPIFNRDIEVSSERLKWWHNRLRRVWQVMN
jgi:O-succinylbenzoate synthase